jgi:hypothetical protein
LAEWGLAAALLLAALSLSPAWLIVDWPAPSKPMVAELKPSPSALPEPAVEAISPNAAAAAGEFLGSIAVPDLGGEVEFEQPPFAQAFPHSADASMVVSSDQPSVSQTPTPSAAAIEEAPTISSTMPALLADLPNWIGLAYGAGMLLFAGHWLLGQIGLWRLLRASAPAPALMRARLAAMAPGKRVQLLVSDQLRIPISCGLFRPTIVVPNALCEPSAQRQLGWVLAHEMTHLQRRDAWACLLFNVGRVVYFYLPWFWWLRRQVRLCQEYIADRAAAPAEEAADYAQFLLGLTGAPAVPAGATGVSGSSSDLFRRISMLLKSHDSQEKRSTRLFSVAAASSFVVMAVLISGVGLRAYDVAPKQEVDKKDLPKKDDSKKDDTKKDDTKKDDPKKDVLDPEKINPEDLDQLRRQIETLQKRQMDEMRKAMQKLQEAQRARNPGGLVPPGAVGGPAGGIVVPVRPNIGGFAADDVFGEINTGREGRLGVMFDRPDSTLAEQLDLPKGQGLIVTQVAADSAAAKAGIKSHDILLELNGKTVSNDTRELTKILADIKPDKPVEAVVLRKGKKETIKGLSLPEAKPAAEFNPLGGFPGGARIELPNPAIPFPPPGGNFLPVVPPNAGGGIAIGRFGSGATVMTTTFRTNDRYTTRHQEGSLIITISGTVADGKAKTSEIQVQDGTKTEKYESTDKVPEAYRDKVKNLIEMSEKGNAKIEIKSP